jgi:hypothetical protein
MISNVRLKTTVVGLVIALGATACAGNDGAGSEPVGAQAGAVVFAQPAPIPESGPRTGCSGYIECLTSSGFPDLVLSCPQSTGFYFGGNVIVGTTFQMPVTDTPVTPVTACMTNIQCDQFPLYLYDATPSYCGAASSGGGGGSTCNGSTKPTSGCRGSTWVCCQEDGWECGHCI